MTKKAPSNENMGISWPDLIPGTLIRRYKRFLADVQLENGDAVTAHCPNSGTMKTCSDSGRRVYLSCHDNPRRKLRYTWEIIQMPDSLVGVNTLIPNKLVKYAIERNSIHELSGYHQVIPEISVGNGSRLDFLLQKKNGARCFVEVKNCTLVEENTAYFPDAVTQRGRKHLVQLQRLIAEGNRCVMFYLVQRMDAETFKPADHIDPAYGRELRKAQQHGVEIIVYDVAIDLNYIRLNRELPYS
jgi:sugar fermentation stimulation protein A